MNSVNVRVVKKGDPEWEMVFPFFSTQDDWIVIHISSEHIGDPVYNAIFDWLEETDCRSYEFSQGTPWGLAGLTIVFPERDVAMLFRLTFG
ncbi:hypothetical protein BKE38_08650 [Pseudoroseomonas deserti]|uniref:Uncharacterized protein n=1 Tax=Teichococcus deserti TaxID=1817963 RepID=A0A1V2H4J9_9PROT|nr:hypothetical protein [Pseudoroseomonas deserti]ONG55726.1 hypothetical protein BKE38_08650 [Pseudoroseomonas deserti]